MSLPATYKAVIVEAAGGPLSIKEFPLQQPARGQLLLKTIASGVCASDNATITGFFGNSFPRVPGHEIIGEVVAVGEGEETWKIGDIAGAGWFGGNCGDCTQCKRNFKQGCVQGQINGVTMDGGYAEYVIIRREAAVVVPKGVDPVEYAPHLCAGVTVFQSIRQLNLRYGATVAVLGLGGLGHLGIGYANKMGYRVVAISSSNSKESAARSFGAHEYIDTSKEDPVQRLKELGGADCIVVTAGDGEEVIKLADGLAPLGTLLILAAMELGKLHTSKLIFPAAKIMGWPVGNNMDSEEAMAFAKLTGVECVVEKFHWTDYQKALDRLNSGKVRFRAVLTF